MAKIRITQIKSVIDRSERQKKTIEALGLKRINGKDAHNPFHSLVIICKNAMACLVRAKA